MVAIYTSNDRKTIHLLSPNATYVQTVISQRTGDIPVCVCVVCVHVIQTRISKRLKVIKTQPLRTSAWKYSIVNFHKLLVAAFFLQYFAIC